MARALVLAFLAAATLCAAADPAWPPPPETQARIERLRRTIGDPAATAQERHAARDELVRLLMNPGAKGAPALAPLPPRAAVDPLAPAKAPVPAIPALPAPTPVAPPAKAPQPVVDAKGGTLVPSGKSAVDPRTGATLLDTGNGWIDPATGRFVPRN